MIGDGQNSPWEFFLGLEGDKVPDFVFNVPSRKEILDYLSGRFGKDKVFKPATATLEGGRLVVQSASVSEPVAVRYCFRNYQTGSVKGANGLPLMPFRSDR